MRKLHQKEGDEGRGGEPGKTAAGEGLHDGRA
jgi:hypothetical protein